VLDDHEGWWVLKNWGFLRLLILTWQSSDDQTARIGGTDLRRALLGHQVFRFGFSPVIWGGRCVRLSVFSAIPRLSPANFDRKTALIVAGVCVIDANL
jgi:hypothetical protein